jgi:glycosyltransferase involved in cell wall biosynthesis
VVSPVTDVFLTIVVACTNIERYGGNLLSWVESVEKVGIEIIVVHDVGGTSPGFGGNPGVIAEIKKLCSYVEISAGNPGTGRNIGLNRATGRWVAFWDIDDSPKCPEFFHMIAIAEKVQADVAIGNFTMYLVHRQASLDVDTTDHLGVFDPFSFAMYPGLWRIAFRRSILANLQFPESRLGEDRVFLCNLGIFDHKIYFHPKSVYTYFRGNSDSLTEREIELPEIQKSLANLRLDRRTFNSQTNRLLSCQTVLNLIFSGIRAERTRTNRTLISLSSRTKVLALLALIIGITNRVLFRARFPIWKVQRVELAGGLGNQLFQYANGLNHGELIELHYALGKANLNAEMLPEIASFRLSDGVSLKNTPVEGYLLKKLFNLSLRISGFLANNRLAFPIIQILHKLERINRSTFHNEKLAKSEPEKLLVGYFQNTNWMTNEKVVDKMKELSLVEGLKFQQSELVLNSNICRLLIHIRRGDYANEKKFGVLSKKYYELSFKKISQKKKFDEIWIFSDDQTHARRIVDGLCDIPIRFVTADMYSPAETFQIMRFFDGYIISNSTFSWWAATLREKADTIVIAPFPWFKARRVDKSFFPEDWIKVDACHEK